MQYKASQLAILKNTKNMYLLNTMKDILLRPASLLKLQFQYLNN